MWQTQDATDREWDAIHVVAGWGEDWGFFWGGLQEDWNGCDSGPKLWVEERLDG